MRATLLGLGLMIAAGACGDGAGGEEGGGGATGGGGSGAGGTQCTLTDEEPTRTVTIAITNDATEDRFVATDGDQCTPYGLAAEEEGVFQPMNMTAPWPCGCECPGPPAARTTRYQRIAPGETYDYIWDARRLLFCHTAEDCGTFEATITQAFWSPISGGQYRMTLGVEAALPERCDAPDADGSIPCAAYVDSDLVGQYGVCATSETVEVTFELAGDDLSLAVSLE